MTVRVLQSIHEVSPQDWNALDRQQQPFLSHEFLAALEDTGCACPATGWTPQHLALFDERNALIAAVPLYLKTHSMGEFVFDFNWASFHDQTIAQLSGVPYYPKLVASVPFTPATGPRLLLNKYGDQNQQRSDLIEAIDYLMQSLQVSSAHVLFANQQDQTALVNAGWLYRTSCQFHWFNRNYQILEDFFATFRAEKRKKIRRERQKVLNESGIKFKTLCGADISHHQWQRIFALSQSTFHRHGHDHYLTAEFLHSVAQALPNQVMVKLAEHQGHAVAAAIFFHNENTLFGRYWGALSHYDSLHFETCYYQGIEFCIERGIQLFEPGTQGEHKIARGFEPTLTYSAHRVMDQRFHSVLTDHLMRERQAVDSYAMQMREHLPFHRSNVSQGS